MKRLLLCLSVAVAFVGSIFADEERKIATVQYWIDNQHDAPSVSSLTEFTIDCAELPPGLHTLQYRVLDDTGRWSGLRSHYFYKGEPSDSANIVSYTFWWNDLKDLATTRVLEVPDVIIEIDEDLQVPEEARTNYAGHYTAVFSLMITDTHGRSSYLCTDVSYPDNDAPVTDIYAENYVVSSDVKLTWSETSGDQIKDYNVYFSKDNGPFILWLPDTKQTSGTFRGERGSMYLFTVTGRDSSGNREKYDETKCISVTFE